MAMPNGWRRSSRSTLCIPATPSPSASRRMEMRLAFSAVEPDRLWAQFCTIARGDQPVLAGSLAASATSTSPFGSTSIQRGCLSPFAKARTCRPLAAFGVIPSGHPSPATDHLMVGLQVCSGAGSFGSGPYPRGSWAIAAVDANAAPASMAMAALRTVDMRAPLAVVHGNAAHQGTFRSDAAGRNKFPCAWLPARQLERDGPPLPQ